MRTKQTHALKMNFSVRFTALLVLPLLVATHAWSATATRSDPVIVDAAHLAREHIVFTGRLVKAYRLGDLAGEHILVLSRRAGPSPAAPESGRIERIDLVAVYYGAGAAGAWRQEWAIRDLSDCPGLDVSGDFFPSNVTFTDLNGDGKTEVTIPYKLFCGGGVDPSVVKVILREGATKLAIRGESRISFQHPGAEAFGGEHHYDAALLSPARQKYKQHLDGIWEQVSIDRRN